jgi:hypothetical protein
MKLLKFTGMNEGKKLTTIKKLSLDTGTSTSFIKQLIREGKLKRYRINSAVFISVNEFEQIALPVTV